MIARGIWLACVLGVIALLAAGLGPWSAGVLAVGSSGPIFFAASAVRFALGLFAMGLWLVNLALVYSQRSRDVHGLIVSFASLFMGTILIVPWVTPSELGVWSPLVGPATAVGASTLMLGILVHPDGRFVPRVSVWLWVAVTVWVILIAFSPDLRPTALGGPWPSLFVGLFICAFISQAYRYRRVATPAQREQLRWWFVFGALFTVVYGLALVSPVAFGGVQDGVSGRPQPSWFGLTSTASVYLAWAALAIAQTYSILRYAWFDVRFIIDRTVAYGVLTAGLVTAFIAASSFLERSADDVGLRSEFVPIALALALGLAYLPLRRQLVRLVERSIPDRLVLTLLFVDIVGSTERAAAVGDQAWRDLRQRFVRTIRRELDRFGGREVDTAGDGVFATFDSPRQAVRAAQTMVAALAAMGLDVRAGLHTGECEVHGNAVSGLNVHIAARVAASAESGGILVSQTVRDIVAGSELRFEDRGIRPLKGVAGEWRLFAPT